MRGKDTSSPRTDSIIRLNSKEGWFVLTPPLPVKLAGGRRGVR